MLFLGSRLGSSQLLAFDCGDPGTISSSAVMRGGAAAKDPNTPTASTTTAPESQVGVQLVDAALLKSLAPVQDCLLVPDSQHADDPTLLVGAGVAPWGRLARAKLGAALSPYTPPAMTLPVRCLIWACLASGYELCASACHAGVTLMT
jgi:hypothetical protein